MNFHMNGRLDEGRFYIVEISLYWYQGRLEHVESGLNGYKRELQPPEGRLWRNTSMCFAIKSVRPGAMVLYDAHNKNEIARVRRASTVSSLVRDDIGPPYLYSFVCSSEGVNMFPCATVLSRGLP